MVVALLMIGWRGTFTLALRFWGIHYAGNRSVFVWVERLDLDCKCYGSFSCRCDKWRWSYFGYRNYQSPDASRNIVPWGILIGGEEPYNNHHAYPTSAKLSSSGMSLIWAIFTFDYLKYSV